MTTTMDTYTALADMNPHTRAEPPEGIEHYAECYPAFIEAAGSGQGYVRTFASLTSGGPLFSVTAFFRWMREQRLGPWAAGATNPVTTGNAPAIGPDHPDWPRWWAQLRRVAEREGYLSYYDTLAEAMGGDGRVRTARYRAVIEWEGPAGEDHESLRQGLVRTLGDTAMTDAAIRVTTL